MPVYNALPYLDRAIESIVAQTFADAVARHRGSDGHPRDKRANPQLPVQRRGDQPHCDSDEERVGCSAVPPQRKRQVWIRHSPDPAREGIHVWKRRRDCCSDHEPPRYRSISTHEDSGDRGKRVR